MSKAVELQEAQKVEALLRMKKLQLHENAIREFKNNGKLNKSVSSRMGNFRVGILFWLTEEEKKMVAELEEEYGVLVYHVIECNTAFGRLLNFFYVSKHVEEWGCDEELFGSNCQCVYVKNLDDETCSEFGCINYQKTAGGLVRTA